MSDSNTRDSSTSEEMAVKDDSSEETDKRSITEMNTHIQEVLQQMREKFQTMSEQILLKIDDMGNRIDDLEKNISDLMNHAGLEAPDK